MLEDSECQIDACEPTVARFDRLGGWLSDQEIEPQMLLLKRIRIFSSFVCIDMLNVHLYMSFCIVKFECIGCRVVV